jgi:hypothetical protein
MAEARSEIFAFCCLAPCIWRTRSESFSTSKIHGADRVDYTINELYKRILKVEKLSDRVRQIHGARQQNAKISDLASAIRGSGNNQ